MSSDTENGKALEKAILNGDWLKQFRRRIMSGEQAMATVGTEPAAVERAIVAGARMIKMPVITWDCAGGFSGVGINIDSEVRRLQEADHTGDGDPDKLGDPGLRSPVSALMAIPKFKLPQTGFGEGSAVFVLHNFYPFFGDPVVTQLFENLVKTNRLSFLMPNGKVLRRPIHFVQQPYQKLDLKGIETVRHWITPMDFPLPDENEFFEEQVAELVEEAKRKDAGGDPEKSKNNYDEPYLRALAASCRGLERHRATSLLFYATSKYGGLTAKVPVEIRREAAALIAASTALEVVPDEEIATPEQLGGIRNAIRSVERAARTYTEKARAQFLDPASGIWMAGLPGTGKSELCKTTAVAFHRTTGRAFTVLRVRMGAIFGGIVGETEQNWYDIERRVEAFGPDTIVWLDELDKAFGNVMSSSGDSGVRMGLFGLVLSWLSNPKRRCFVVAAMNSPVGIPGEMFRRFDDGFFFDLPATPARLDILKIHFKKRLKKMGKSLDDLGFSADQWNELADATEGWIPSEIEGLVKQARDAAFEAREVAIPTFDETMTIVEIQKTAILSVQKKDQLDELRNACRHAKPVDLPPEEAANLVSAMAPTKGKPKKRALDFSDKA